MGLSFTKIWARLAGKQDDPCREQPQQCQRCRFWALHQDRKIVMVGLDAAGKTTVLYKLKLNELLMTIPTIGQAFKRISYRNDLPM